MKLCPRCGGTGQVRATRLVDRHSIYGLRREAQSISLPCPKCDGQNRREVLEQRLSRLLGKAHRR